MLRSLALLTIVSLAPALSSAYAQGAIGPNAVPLGLYVDLDSNNNVTTVYPSRQDPTAHPATTWLPINDARIQAFYAARAPNATVGYPGLTVPIGIPQQ